MWFGWNGGKIRVDQVFHHKAPAGGARDRAKIASRQHLRPSRHCYSIRTGQDYQDNIEGFLRWEDS